jgi:hypothetical protein
VRAGIAFLLFEDEERSGTPRVPSLPCRSSTLRVGYGGQLPRARPPALSVARRFKASGGPDEVYPRQLSFTIETSPPRAVGSGCYEPFRNAVMKVGICSREARPRRGRTGVGRASHVAWVEAARAGMRNPSRPFTTTGETGVPKRSCRIPPLLGTGGDESGARSCHRAHRGIANNR